jgi:hypothetical protein
VQLHLATTLEAVDDFADGIVVNPLLKELDERALSEAALDAVEPQLRDVLGMHATGWLLLK